MPINLRTPPIAAAAFAILLAIHGVRAEDPAELAVDQAALAAKFDRLEALALRIAEVIEKEDAERAEQLRGAIRHSREMAITDRFASVVDLLETERLSAADKNQQELVEQLGELMRLLLADPREAKAEAERKRLEALLKEVGRFIKTQQSLRNALFDGQAPKSVAERQTELADKVERARKQAEGADGKPGERTPSGGQKPRQGGAPKGKPGSPNQGGQGQSGQPGPVSDAPTEPLDRAKQRLAQAQQAMQQAIDDLKSKETDQAKKDQSDAQQRLEEARREIEEALEQLREEEQIRMLTRLATRFRRMLAEQTEIYELTKSTAQSAPKPADRATRLAAAGLSERELALSRLADGALRLLEEDGKSIAFPETVAQLRGDMRQAADWLGKVRLGVGTQRLEEDILEQLQAAISAFEQAAADKQQQQQAGDMPSGGQQGDRALVDLLAELRMVRSLQARLLRRTEMWDAMLASGEASPEIARESLRGLAKNQARLAAAAESLQKSMASR